MLKQYMFITTNNYKHPYILSKRNFNISDYCYRDILKNPTADEVIKLNKEYIPIEFTKPGSYIYFILSHKKLRNWILKINKNETFYNYVRCPLKNIKEGEIFYFKKRHTNEFCSPTYYNYKTDKKGNLSAKNSITKTLLFTDYFFV